jgi:Spherulation-specific family 4
MMNASKIFRRVPRLRWSVLLIFSTILSLTTMLCGEPVQAAKLEIVVPAYFYPSGGSDWNDLNDAVDKVPITAIMNPGSGPGSSVDSNYVSAVNSFRAAGGRVIGYVYTSYTSRLLSQVLSDVDKYDMWYNIDGIFVDEMSNTGPAERLDYYRDVYNHVKGIDPNWEVMGNPGTTTLEQYLTWPTADRLMVFENVGSAYPGYVPSSWNFDYDRSKFVHLVHTESSSNNMLSDLQLAIQNNAGGIYVTDDVLPNPWDRVPNYWTALVNAVAAINADYNNNGAVDAADYTVWRDTLGQTGVSLAADGNGDGVVNLADFEHWRDYFGEPVVGGAGVVATLQSVTVPEPSSATLVALLFMVLSAVIRCAQRTSEP